MSEISSELDAHFELESSVLQHSKTSLQQGRGLKAAANEQALSLTNIEQRYDIWRGRSIACSQEGLSSGHPVIDESLHIGGWPRAGLLEVLLSQPGCQELSLLMPAIAKNLKPHQRIAFVGLPYLLMPSALKAFGVEPQQVWCIQTPKLDDQLWAMQQLLKCGHCLMVMTWQLHQKIRNAHLRKLQVAAKAGQSCGVVFRHEQCQQQTSPASMRIYVRSVLKSGNFNTTSLYTENSDTSNFKSSNYCKDRNLSDVVVKVIKQPKTFSGQTLSLSHPLKKHQCLDGQQLPVFSSVEKNNLIRHQETNEFRSKPGIESVEMNFSNKNHTSNNRQLNLVDSKS